jgi:hypothetical protein
MAWGEVILRPQLGIRMSGPEGSALMLSQFLFGMLPILLQLVGDWV